MLLIESLIACTIAAAKDRTRVGTVKDCRLIILQFEQLDTTREHAKETRTLRRNCTARITFSTDTLEECRSMPRNSRKTNTRAMEEMSNCGEDDEQWSTGMTSDVGANTAEQESDFGTDDESHGRAPSTNSGFRRSVLSTMLLSLLPLPSSAYPQPRSNAVRRDRRRSSSSWSSRGSDRRASERSEGSETLEEIKGMRQVVGGSDGNASVHPPENEVSVVTVQTSEVR